MKDKILISLGVFGVFLVLIGLPTQFFTSDIPENSCLHESDELGEDNCRVGDVATLQLSSSVRVNELTGADAYGTTTIDRNGEEIQMSGWEELTGGLPGRGRGPPGRGRGPPEFSYSKVMHETFDKDGNYTFNAFIADEPNRDSIVAEGEYNFTVHKAESPDPLSLSNLSVLLSSMASEILSIF